MKKLYVVGGSYGYANWVLPLGYDLTDNLDESHLILFTGGSDIGSHLYGHKQLPCTWANPRRDNEEVDIFQKYAGKIPILGVCRGHQLISALSGSKIIQDLNHPSRHLVNTYNGEQMFSNSLHHQAVHILEDVKDDCSILAWTERLSKDYIYADCDYKFPEDYREIEAIFWHKTQAFGVQGHPELLSIDSPFVKWCQKQIKHCFI